MPLDAAVLDEISVMVRGGFEDRDTIIQVFLEEKYAPGDLDESEVTAAVDAAVAKHEEDKKTWPAVTDCDRLASAFENLNKKGIIALHHAGYTQSDGFDDVVQTFDEHPDQRSVVGYCYYHGQDLERVVQGDGLYFSFGPIDSEKEDAEGPRVGAIIVAELEQAGFTVDWDGTFKRRIFLPRFDWKNR